MTFFREVQVLSWNTTHAGGVECAHTLRGIDTEVFLPVDDQNRGIPFSNEFVRGIVKRALSNLVVLFPGGAAHIPVGEPHLFGVVVLHLHVKDSAVGDECFEAFIMMSGKEIHGKTAVRSSHATQTVFINIRFLF